ncbi:MAG TPA: AAA family ATPase, partial [Candidatus Hodarchaeales archaeon]|nr:AAA family ATPase [Candidatus Hodarchaeales archaeon]
FPKIKEKNIGVKQDAFAQFVYQFNDCVTLIESSRDMLPASFSGEPPHGKLGPHNFKQFLHSLYLSEKENPAFNEINKVFSEDPFGFGALSFAAINKEIEVMIRVNETRLPIKHVGSGVLQTLFVIAQVITSRGKIVCIEELEQNLAPALQFKTLRKLQSMIGRNNLSQILISSHSSVYAKPKIGMIYLIQRADDRTVIKDILTRQYKKGIKDHFIDSALPPDTYTEKEWQDNLNQQLRMGEEGFRR